MSVHTLMTVCTCLLCRSIHTLIAVCTTHIRTHADTNGMVITVLVLLTPFHGISLPQDRISRQFSHARAG